MNPGRLNQWVKLRKWTDAPNVAFGLDQELDPGIDRWAAIDPIGSLTFMAAKQTGNDVTDRITFRYEDGTLPHQITPEHVIESACLRYRVVRSVDLEGRQRYTAVDVTLLELIA